MTLTPPVREYLASQRLGRLATIGPAGEPQNRPVGYFVNDDGTIDIGGYTMGASQKFRNAAARPRVSLVVDDIASTDPWTVRGVEVRGHAEALTDVDPPMPVMSRELLRIHPERVLPWGLD